MLDLAAFAAGPSVGEDLTTGLVMHWKCDEGAGTTINDSSGLGNHGEAQQVSWTTGNIYANAYNFGTPNREIVILSNPSINLTGNQITVAAHIEFTTSQSGKALLCKWWPDYGWILSIPSTAANKLTFAVRTSTATNKAAVTANTYNSGNWLRVIGWYNGANVFIEVYDSGSLLESITGDAHTENIINTTADVTAGCYGDRAGDFVGSGEDFYLYNRVLTAAQRQALANRSP